MRRPEGLSPIDGTHRMAVLSGLRLLPEANLAAKKLAKPSNEQQDSSGGGLGGMLARKMMKKKPQENAEGAAANRANVMTTNHEVLSVALDVTADAVTIPAGFKEK